MCGVARPYSTALWRSGNARLTNKQERMWFTYLLYWLKHNYSRECTYGGSSHLLADVLSSERTAARAAFKATDMPLSLQSQQRLTLFDFLATACTV